MNSQGLNYRYQERNPHFPQKPAPGALKARFEGKRMPRYGYRFSGRISTKDLAESNIFLAFKINNNINNNNHPSDSNY